MKRPTSKTSSISTTQHPEMGRMLSFVWKYGRTPPLELTQHMEHQRRHHDFPYSGISTIEELVEMATHYIKDLSFYEASVCLYMLSNIDIIDNSEDGDIVCHYRYD